MKELAIILNFLFGIISLIVFMTSMLDSDIERGAIPISFFFLCFCITNIVALRNDE